MVYPHSYRQKNSETITTSFDYGAYFARQVEFRIRIQPELLKTLQWIDQMSSGFKADLAEFIKIPSISNKADHLMDCYRMIKLTESWLKRLNVQYECFNIGKFKIDGKEHEIPSVIIAQLGREKNNYTICVYCQMDIKNPEEQAEWNTNPFNLELIDKVFYGAGIVTSKAPLMMWFNVIRAFQETHTKIPVNLKFVFQCMHEHNNIGFETFLRTQAIGCLKNVDFICMHDTTWIGPNLPCLTYGCVGYCIYAITAEKVEGSSTDPTDDLNLIKNSILDENGRILIPSFQAFVAQITPDEEVIYENIRDFDIESLRSSLPEHQKHWNKMKILMYFWRMPSFKLHPIEECNCEKKLTTAKKVKMMLVCKIVPNQIPDRLTTALTKYLASFAKEMNIGNKIESKLIQGNRPWIEDPSSVHYEAARRATIQIYKEIPSLIREDREIPSLLIFNRVFKKNIVLLPLGNSLTNPREANENISQRCFIEGTKLLAAYIFQVSYIEKEKPEIRKTSIALVKKKL